MSKYSKSEKPENSNCILIAECPDWNELGYQVCIKKNNGEFEYPDQPNDMFNDHVIGWDYLTDEYGEKVMWI